MGNERYELELEADAVLFEFTSIGPKGRIPKLVMYSKTSDKDVYNLAFGDKNIITGGIDDLAVTDNKDSQKVLTTVAFTAYAFLSKYPNAWINATGSTKVRTRLYQMGISTNLEDIMADFVIFGKQRRQMVSV